MRDIIEKFGDFIAKQAIKNPIMARKLILVAYNLKKIQLKYFVGKDLVSSKREVGLIMVQSIINCLKFPKKSAMVSLFAPCEPLHAMGIYPYSVEGLSSYLTGAYAHKAFLEHTGNEGVPETLCSYHRIFLGAAELGVMPKPKFIIYTNLACDANQITFKNLAKYFDIPSFEIDVPYDISEDSVLYVADQLREMVKFIEKCEGRKFDQKELIKAVKRTKNTVDYYNKYLELQKDKYLKGDITSELYAAFANHVLLGTQEAERFSQMSFQDVKKSPENKGIKLLWLHTIPFWQQSVRKMLNFSEKVHISACDMSYESLTEVDESKPYESMARRLVYSGFNGGASHRINEAIKMAKKIKADGVVYFCHWGCKATLGSAQMVKQSLEQNGFPTLILDGDGCDPQNSSDGQVATRLGAFIEMLEGR